MASVGPFVEKDVHLLLVHPKLKVDATSSKNGNSAGFLERSCLHFTMIRDVMAACTAEIAGSVSRRYHKFCKETHQRHPSNLISTMISRMTIRTPANACITAMKRANFRALSTHGTEAVDKLKSAVEDYRVHK